MAAGRHNPGMTRPGIAPGRSAARLAAGLLSVAAGVFWLVMAPVGGDGGDVVTGAALILGGVVLLVWDRLRMPGWAVAAGAGAAGLVGTLAGLFVFWAGVCCMFAYSEGRGWPFTWLSRGATADDPEVARQLAVAEGWEVDLTRLCASAVVWSYAGMVLLAVIGLLRGSKRE